MHGLIDDILRDLLWELIWPPVRDWMERRRGESLDQQWRRVGIWFALPSALVGGLAALVGFAGGGWMWAAFGPITVGCTWVVGRWLLGVARCGRRVSAW